MDWYMIILKNAEELDATRTLVLVKAYDNSLFGDGILDLYSDCENNIFYINSTREKFIKAIQKVFPQMVECEEQNVEVLKLEYTTF